MCPLPLESPSPRKGFEQRGTKLDLGGRKAPSGHVGDRLEAGRPGRGLVVGPSRRGLGWTGLWGLIEMVNSRYSREGKDK